VEPAALDELHDRGRSERLRDRSDPPDRLRGIDGDVPVDIRQAVPLHVGDPPVLDVDERNPRHTFAFHLALDRLVDFRLECVRRRSQQDRGR